MVRVTRGWVKEEEEEPSEEELRKAVAWGLSERRVRRKERAGGESSLHRTRISGESDSIWANERVIEVKAGCLRGLLARGVLCIQKKIVKRFLSLIIITIHKNHDGIDLPFAKSSECCIRSDATGRGQCVFEWGRLFLCTREAGRGGCFMGILQRYDLGSVWVWAIVCLYQQQVQ